MARRDQPAVPILCEHRIPSTSYCSRCDAEKIRSQPKKRKGKKS